MVDIDKDEIIGIMKNENGGVDKLIFQFWFISVVFEGINVTDFVYVIEEHSMIVHEIGLSYLALV